MSTTTLAEDSGSNSNLHLPRQDVETITLGEWGALKNGSEEKPFDHSGNDGIKRIVIYCGTDIINSIRVQYTRHGELKWTEKAGVDEGQRQEISLDDSDEYITKLTGYYDLSEGVNSFTLLSNLKTYGPFGKKRHNSHPFECSGGKLVGFKGTAGSCISSIGFYVLTIIQSCENCRSKCIVPTTSTTAEVPNINQVPPKIDRISVGPFGNQSAFGEGFNNNHAEYDGIKRIVIIVHGRCIKSLMVEYMKNEQPQPFKQVGKKEVSSTEVVLDYPQEFLQAVRGNYIIKDYDYGSCITSLTFYSNVRKYGPFGYEHGQSFEVSGGKIVGIQGISGSYINSLLYAIGFHIAPIKSPPPLCGSCYANDVSHKNPK